MIGIKQFMSVIDQLDQDAIGKIYCDLNGLKWCSRILGVPPKGWKNMSPMEKHIELNSHYLIVRSYLSERDQSMYWWKFELKRSKEEWEKWWIEKNLIEYGDRKRRHKNG